MISEHCTRGRTGGEAVAKEMTNRKKAALETKKKLIEAAREIISEKGFDNVSVGDIAKKAGVATGSFYTYFKRKEDIIEELNKTDFYRLAGIVNQMTDKTILEKLDNYCRVFMKAVERAGLEVCRQWLRNRISAVPAENESESMKYRYDYQAVYSVLKEAVKQKQLREDTPIEELAFLINSELYGLIAIWCMSDGKIAGSGHTKKYCELMLQRSIGEYMTYMFTNKTT